MQFATVLYLVAIEPQQVNQIYGFGVPEAENAKNNSQPERNIPMSSLLENEPDQSQFKRNGETPWSWAQEALTQAPCPPIGDDLTDLEKWMKKYREWFTGPREGARLKLWRVEDLAAYVGVDPGWIYERTNGQSEDCIPHLRFGKYIRFNPESQALREWIDAHIVTPR
jgi:hypothetical protein